MQKMDAWAREVCGFRCITASCY